MTDRPGYFDRYPNIAFRREDGVLEMALHTDGGRLCMDTRCHADLCLAFERVAADPDNRVVILTGRGESFCADVDVASFMALRERLGDAEYGGLLASETRRLVNGLLAIEVPVIAAVNGPATARTDLALLADVVLCSDTAYLSDESHFASGSVPGDGVQIAWLHVLGPNRGRYHLLTGKRVDAAEALRFGMVGEVLSPDALMPRAWALAREWAAKPMHLLRGTRQVLTAEWRQVMARELDAGFAQELVAILAAPVPAGAAAAGDDVTS